MTKRGSKHGSGLFEHEHKGQEMALWRTYVYASSMGTRFTRDGWLVAGDTFPHPSSLIS